MPKFLRLARAPLLAGLLQFVFSLQIQAALLHTFPFKASDTRFDLTRGLVLAANAAGKEIQVLRLDTGEISSIQLTEAPQALAISPDAQFLYAGTSDGQGKGKLAQIDLAIHRYRHFDFIASCE